MLKCQDYDHVATQCPSKNLLVREANNDEITIIVYEPTGSATNSDSDDVRISSIQFGVIKCSHTTVRDEDWLRSNVFHTYITHEGKSYKLMINGGSCVNTISKTALEKMGLKAEHIPTHKYELD